MLRTIPTLTLCTGLTLALAAPAPAQLTPSAACADAVGNEGAKFLSKLMKVASACEAKKAKGLFPPNSYCRTDFVMVTSNIPASFADEVFRERARFTERVYASACTPELLANHPFDRPCGELEGVASQESLARCLIHDGHGQSAANVQLVVNLSTNPCWKNFAQAVAAHTKKIQTLYRKCARAVAIGRTCDDAALGAAVVKSRAASVDRVIGACGDASTFLGGRCYGNYAAAADAAECALDEAESEAMRLVRMAYDLPFVTEEEW